MAIQPDKTQKPDKKSGTARRSRWREILGRLTARLLRNKGVDDEPVDVPTEIVENGTLHGWPLITANTVVFNEETPDQSMRQWYAALFADHPKTAETLNNLRIVGLHGTSSSALPGILEEGALLSSRELRRRHKRSLSGEYLHQNAAGQNGVSFVATNDMNSVSEYINFTTEVRHRTTEEVIADLEKLIKAFQKEASDSDEMASERYKKSMAVRQQEMQDILNDFRDHPDGLRAEMTRTTFPVIFGISDTSLFQGEIERRADDPSWRPDNVYNTDYREFRPARDAIDLDELLIAVPEEKIDEIKALYSQYGRTPLVVLPIEHLVGRYLAEFGDK